MVRVIQVNSDPVCSSAPIVVVMRVAPIAVARHHNTSGQRDGRESKRDQSKHVLYLRCKYVGRLCCRIMWQYVVDSMAIRGRNRLGGLGILGPGPRTDVCGRYAPQKCFLDVAVPCLVKLRQCCREPIGHG